MPRPHARPFAFAVSFLLLAAHASCAPLTNHAAPAARERPKLVVLISVDQMRADYVDWYGAHWTGGLRRLYDEGAVLRNARYPYLHTATGPGHATLGTGTYPRTNGMVHDDWLDRRSNKMVECTDDPDAPLLAHGAAKIRPGAGKSARNLLAPTLGDELQAQLSPRPRVVSFSLKARSAINLAGHHPDVALWFDSGTWVTSSAFAAAPVPWVMRLLDEAPMSATVETSWTRLLPAALYKYDDDAAGEAPPRGWTRSFPHEIKTPGSAGMGRWMSSPAADSYLVRLAERALVEMKLGQGPTTDLLAVGFSETDITGHAFGPRSHEIQDVLARLDLELGRLLQSLDATVGRDRYVLALSADHGIAVIPEQARAEGKDAGRVLAREVRSILEDAVTAALGTAGPHVLQVYGSDIYLAAGVHAALAAKPGALERALDAIRAIPGIAYAFDRNRIKDAARSNNPVLKAAALSFYEGRSPDIVMSVKSGWVLAETGVVHGSALDYDQRVPMVFFGKGVKPGRYDLPASPADLAPTLARIAGVTMPQAEGRALAAVLAQ